MLRYIASLLALFAVAWPASAQPGRPNIVFILADDLGIGDLGSYNKDSKIPTPNIDAVARRGMRFSDAHSPSAVCSPTRYGILTGRYAWRTKLKRGVLQGYDPYLIERGRLTWPLFLQRLGYRTAGIGKWHLGLGNVQPADYHKALDPGPKEAGFDYFFGIPSSLDFPPYVFLENDHATAAPSEQVTASKSQREGGGGFWREGAIAPGFKHSEVLPTLTQKAVAWLQKQKSDQPFFLYFALSGPHTPWLPAKEYQGKSQAGPYGDFVVQVDAAVGEIVRTLERLGLADNTLIIVTSDNGAHWTPEDILRYGHRANLFWRGQKADIWEAGHRIPLIAAWKEHIPANSTSDETICLTDMFATTAALLRQPLPRNAAEDSASILPALLGQKHDRPLREATVHHSGSGTFAIRRGEWVLIEGLGSGGFTKPQQEKPTPGGPRGQLYNLARDPGQQRNQYLGEPDRVIEMQALLDRYRNEGRSVAR
jgi:arylsulfatase A-like enzyme